MEKIPLLRCICRKDKKVGEKKQAMEKEKQEVIVDDEEPNEKGKQAVIVDDEEPNKKGKQVVIVDEETKWLRGCFDKDVVQPYVDALLRPQTDLVFEIPIYKREYFLSILGGFFKYVEESPAVVIVPGTTQVYDDLALLRAILIDLPQRFFGYGMLMREIHYLADRAASIICKYDLKQMYRQEAFELVKELNCILQIMSHWMDLIRIIYGKPPKASPPLVYYFVDNPAPVDALVDYYLHRSPSKQPWMEVIVKNILLLCAILMHPPQEFIEDDDATLKKLEYITREVGFTVSSIDPNNVDQHMAFKVYNRLEHIFESPPRDLRVLLAKVELICAERPKPSPKYYPKTAQLDFVGFLLGNLQELLPKLKVDPSIHVLDFDISRFQQALQDVSIVLVEIPEPRKEEADIKDAITNIANLAYEAEYVIDSFLVGYIPIWCSMLWLRDTLQELEHQGQLIKQQFGDVGSIVSSIRNMRSTQLQIIPIFHNDTKIRNTLNQVFQEIHHLRYVCTRSLVSSYKERKKKVLLDLLRNAFDQRKKGVLLALLHNAFDEDLESDGRRYTEAEFQELRSVYRRLASYSERKRKVLLDLLRNDYDEDPENDEIDYYYTEAELESLVRDRLYHKNNFIILEDVQDIHILNDIIRVLPGDSGHKKTVLLTTRSPELVLQCRYGFHHMSEPHPSTSQIGKATTDNDVVGFMKETESMLEQLIRGSRKLHIISIVGMAGQGKTTLAKKLFNHPRVNEYFDTRAWCCVSQVYETKQLLLELVGHVVQLSNRDHQKGETELADMLYKQLKGRRFLIFLDDMWEVDAWNDLRRCFNDDNNGSRIMFTTRIQELASRAKSGSIVQSLGLLSDDESWTLLEKKLFQKESCPTELLDLGSQIAKNCKGLPLSVVLTAGLLAKVEKSVNQWKQIVEISSSLILRDAEAQGQVIIELSYKHLPDRLKSCFLYFGAFLEDKEVPVSKLIRLWIAEGFIKHDELKSLEDVAKDYFTDLIGRSLVTISQEKSNGGAKLCRVHDLLREFCLTKAKEENFLQKIDGYDQEVCPNNSSSSKAEKCHLRRLCMHPKRNYFTMLKPSELFIRSLLFFAPSDTRPSFLYDMSSIFDNFKLLKILNLEGVNVGNSIKGIGGLILLRYLACQSSVDLVPSSIANLSNLQVFLFKGLGTEVVKVPDSILDMTKLRHVHIKDNISFELDRYRLENSFIFDNLQTFSRPSLSHGDYMEKIIRKFRGIQKLKCIFLDSWNEATECNQFPELRNLIQLVSLNVFYNGKRMYPCEFNFPSNLKKLTLSNFHMPWNEFSQLAKLYELEVLKLLDNAFEGRRWDMEDEVFPKLKFLKLDFLNIIEWNAPGDHFPLLECLILHKCEHLEEIPPKIGEIATLQMIEVMWCSHFIENSVRKIQEEQLDFCNEGLKIHVHPKAWDLESSSSNE